MTGEPTANGATAPRIGGNAFANRPRRFVDTQTAVALLAVGAVGFGTNLAIQLINLGLHSRGVAAASIGLSTMMQAVDIVLVAPLAPRAMRSLGVKETIIAGAALAAFCMFGFAGTTDYYFLTALRVSYAAGLALVFTCAEFLILSRSPHETRGWSAGLYTTVLGLGMAAGPALISVVGFDGATACYVGALTCLACIPAAAIGIPALSPPDRERGGNHTGLLRLAPIGFTAAFLFGFLDNGPVSLLAVFGIEMGWNASQGALLVSAATVAALMCQMPIGWAVDRFEAGLVFRLGCLLAATLLLLLPHVWSVPLVAVGCVLGLGSVMEGLYTVGLADIGKRVPSNRLGNANALFVMACGAGEVVGPVLTGLAINIVT